MYVILDQTNFVVSIHLWTIFYRVDGLCFVRPLLRKSEREKRATDFLLWGWGCLDLHTKSATLNVAWSNRQVSKVPPDHALEDLV